MKTIPSLVMLAAAGLALLGCGSETKAVSEPEAVSGSITVAGTTTISNVQTGAVITCSGGQPTVTVPEWPGQAAAVSGPSTGRLRLTRSQGGTVVSCTR